MSYRNFLDEMKKKMPSPAYMLVSSDPFLHSEAVSLIKALVPQHEADFNLDIVDLLDTNGASIEAILDIVNTVPFFGGRKFVIVENFQKLPKKEFKKIETYLRKPCESSVLVLLSAGGARKETGDDLPGIKRILLDIMERDIPAWLAARAKMKGIELSRAAVDFLIGAIGPDLGLLSSEVEKCALIGKTVIGEEDLAGIIEGKRTYSAFALVDALRAKDSERVFRIYRVLKDTEEPYSLIGALNWQYGRFLSEKNTPDERDYYMKVFTALNSADIAVKSSGGAYPMELLLVTLLRLRKT